MGKRKHRNFKKETNDLANQNLSTSEDQFVNKGEKFCQGIGLSNEDLLNMKKYGFENQVTSTYRNSAPVEVVIFKDPTKPRSDKKKKAVEETATASDHEGPGIDLRKARLEILRFGAKGMNEVDKRTALKEMLIKLGAKPPRKEYLNYKELMAKRRDEKSKERADKTTRYFDQGKLDAIESLNLFKKRLKQEKGKKKGGAAGSAEGAVKRIKSSVIKIMGGNNKGKDAPSRRNKSSKVAKKDSSRKVKR